MDAREAKAVLDALLPLAPTGHVLDLAPLRGEASAAGEWIAAFVAVGARFGDVFLLPAEKGRETGRWIVARRPSRVAGSR